MDWFELCDVAKADDTAILTKPGFDTKTLWSLAASFGAVRILQAMLDAGTGVILIRDLGQHEATDALFIPTINKAHAISKAVGMHDGYKPLVALLKVATPEDLKDPTLMHMAVMSCCEMEQKVASLYKAGVPLDTRDDDGYTPLMKAVKHGQGATAAILVALGASTEGADELLDTEIKGLLPADAWDRLKGCGKWFAASGVTRNCIVDQI